jgi:hypothetical protein
LPLIVVIPVCAFFACTSFVGSLVRNEKPGEGITGFLIAVFTLVLFFTQFRW